MQHRDGRVGTAALARVRSPAVALLVLLSSLLAGYLAVRIGASTSLPRVVLFGVALVVAATAAIWPRLAVAGLVAVVPFQFEVRLGPVLTGTNEIAVVGVAVLIAARIRWAAVPTWLRYGGSLIVVGSSLAGLGAVAPAHAWWGAGRWLAVLVIAWAACDLYRRDPHAAARLGVIISGTGIVVALLAVGQRAGINTIVGPPYLPDRVDSSFGYYTNYAGFMAVVFVISAALVIEQKLSLVLRALAGTGAVAGLVGVGLSLSRGGLLAALVGTVSLVLLQLGSARAVVLLLLLPLMVAGGWLLLPADVAEEFAGRFTEPFGASGADRTRVTLQEAGAKALEDRPLGLGYGNFAEYVKQNVALPSRKVLFHAHQTFVQIGLDAGWIGLVGYVVMLCGALAAALRCTRLTRLPAISAGFAAALAALSAQGLGDYLYVELSFVVLTTALAWGCWHAACNSSSTSRARA